ncbi:acyl-CoA dehydrogenase family protein [Actinomadura rugatobispora]|uniref:Acyl-CoA dehydrogenase family protein n=1 Tax=Actinomadura rugatobispora TaxID=1994 RepID=A0ABW0ZZK0_9ACTN|nr:acyl-CoA dehydrogenase family protein [Actinomadura rugatobispora]
MSLSVSGPRSADGRRDQLRVSLRELLSPDGGPSAGAVAPPEEPSRWWKGLAEFGVFALAVPEERGGLGLGLAESALASEELGRALGWGPLVWAQLAALAVPELASGELVVTGVDRDAGPEGDPLLVEHLAAADRLLVLSGDGVHLHARDGVDFAEVARPLDPLTPIARIDRLPEGERVAGAETAARLRRAGTLLSAAFLLGISDAALHVAIGYAKERRQFGRPIGSFQAIKHLLADCYVRTSLARAALYAASELEAVDGTGADLPAAKLLCGRAANDNARAAVQVFGGMGFSWESSPHLLLKRAWVLDSAFGSGERHALLVADDLARDPEAAA